jgi:hypothetical protein
VRGRCRVIIAIARVVSVPDLTSCGRPRRLPRRGLQTLGLGWHTPCINVTKRTLQGQFFGVLSNTPFQDGV